MQRLVDQIKAHRTLSIVMLACVLVVTLAGVIGAVQMYQQYSATRSEASSGMQHLKRVQALAKPLTKQLTIPDPILVQSIKTELTLAENDFARARQDASGWGVSLAAHAPVVGGSAGSAINLITAADEATRGGLSLVNALELAQPLLHGGFLAPETGTKTPLLTPATMNLIIQDFETAVGKFNSAVTLAQNADLSAIPTSLVSASQRSDLNQLVAKWPSVQAQLQSVDAWLQLGPSMLGLNGPQRYLIQLLDRGEMRSTGGFVGSYGILTMQSGQMQPFTLNDSFGLDVPYIQRDGPQPPPAKYYWWPFSGYALRDSNLSFDFPTSAKYGIQLLKQEGGPDVQGVAAITIPVIQRAMKVIGDVPLPEYGVTVTGDNLEAMIRLYTETKAANVGSDLPPSDQLTTLHQRFTALLGRAFMAKLHKATPKQLVSIAQIMMASLPTKELQVYLSNPTAEGLLKAHGFDNSIARGPQDAITAVDSNTAGNKANLFITVKYNDAVTIDAHGTATHHLTIAYDFNHNSNPEFVHYLYDRWYYKDYLRVYTPANSKLISYDGFNDGDLQINVSDEPGRQMWGGYVWMAEGGIYALHFTYTVPNAATQDSAGHWHYPLIFQHQAASKQQLTLTVTLPGASKPIQVYNGVIDRDRLFNIQ